MKQITYTLIVLLTLATISLAQVKTGEKKMVINKVTGDTTYTEAIIISESEDITPRSNMIVINPLKFFLFYNISYFHKVSESVVVGGGFQAPTISGLSGFGINGEVRIHPSGKNMRGFYIAPNFSFNSLSDSENTNVNIISIGALVGWQWFPGDEFAMGLGIGLDMYYGNQNDDTGDFDDINGLAPAVRFDIGYAW